MRYLSILLPLLLSTSSALGERKMISFRGLPQAGRYTGQRAVEVLGLAIAINAGALPGFRQWKTTLPTANGTYFNFEQTRDRRIGATGAAKRLTHEVAGITIVEVETGVVEVSRSSDYLAARMIAKSRPKLSSRARDFERLDAVASRFLGINPTTALLHRRFTNESANGRSSEVRISVGRKHGRLVESNYHDGLLSALTLRKFDARDRRITAQYAIDHTRYYCLAGGWELSLPSDGSAPTLAFGRSLRLTHKRGRFVVETKPVEGVMLYKIERLLIERIPQKWRAAVIETLQANGWIDPAEAKALTPPART
ncbi:MAG: hypothetical protein H6707_18290 [Deltaproteobacteria bacterium]|nr:hypothetical protein [Deltaproteobacteria bacterium]